MGRRNWILVILLLLAVASLVGFGAFQAGVHVGADGDFGPREGYYERGYGYHGWGFFPFGFIFPLLFIVLILLLIRGLLWHRHSGGHGYYGPGYWGSGPWQGPGAPQGPWQGPGGPQGPWQGPGGPQAGGGAEPTSSQTGEAARPEERPGG